MSRSLIFLSLIVSSFVSSSAGWADSPKASEYSPDPKSVERYGPAYRYPQAGWIVLHIEGKPYDRGYQHGTLMTPEIAGYLRCFATMLNHRSPADGWKNTRTLINALFLRRYKPEYLEEMKGIADGATAAGARFDDRPIDLIDIVGLNGWPEIDTLESALEATPTGLEGIRFPKQQPRTMPDPKPMHCSAFAATGPATANGKIVFGDIAMFGLGTGKTKLYRSSKNEWFGGTEGFYWGCNNTKDLDVRLETIPGVKGRPANVVWRPTDRDKTWQQLFNDHKGKIDVAFGKLAFTTPPLAAYHSLDAKFTTTDLAKQLKTWALFGPPLGRTWEPSPEERSRFPEVRPMVSNPWTILRADPPARSEGHLIAAVDLKGFQSRVEQVTQEEQEKQLPTVPAWYGTVFPKTAADVWLAAAFSDYERIVALETAMWK